MRITCPNCDAEYEVDEALIPPNGRDVQCSNCGKGWFQEPLTQEEPAAAVVPPPEPEPPAKEEEPVVPKPEPEPVADPAPAPMESATPDLVDEDAMGEDTPPPPPSQPRQPDEEALKILREEAEREMRAREAEAQQALQSQPDLNLDTATAGATVAAAATAVSANARGDLLPDIEEINSTLDPNSLGDEGKRGKDPVAQQRGGFRWGFSLFLFIAVVLILLYVFAPQLADAVPALEGFLTTYVDAGNVVRDRINNLIGRGVGAP